MILKNRSWLAMKPYNCNPLGFCVNLLHPLSLLTSAQIFHFDLKKNSWQQPTASQFHNNAHSYVHVILCAINCQFIFSIIIVSAATAAVHRSLFFLFFLSDKLHKNLYLFCLVMAYKMNITIMSVLSSEASEWVRVTQLTQFFTTSMWWLEIMLKKSSKKKLSKRGKIILKKSTDSDSCYKGNQLSIDTKKAPTECL